MIAIAPVRNSISCEITGNRMIKVSLHVGYQILELTDDRI